MRRFVGTALILHGLAHAGIGMWVSPTPSFLVTVLWWIAMAGFVAAGAGLFGVPRLDARWRPLAVTASLASLLLVALQPHPILLIGAAVDGAILIDSISFAHEAIGRQLGLMLHPPQRHLGRVGTGVAVIAIAYVSILVLTRPWNATWGVTAAELAAPLPGDEPSDSTTRFHVRTRGAAQPTLGAITIAPFGLLVFEPAHFITQRGMLLGIRDRAEHAWRTR
jgi:hypothetical protein